MVVVAIHALAKDAAEGDDGSLVGLGSLGYQVARHCLHSSFSLAAPGHVLIDILTALALALHIVSIEIMELLVKSETDVAQALRHTYAAVRIMDEAGACASMDEIVAGGA